MIIGLSFTPASSIEPAQVLPFTWSLFLFRSANESLGGSVTASLIVDGTVIWTRALVPVFTRVLLSKPPDPDLLLQQIPGQQDSVPPLAAGTQAALSLYEIGQRPIQLQVLGDGPSPGPLVAAATVSVVPNPFPGAAWTWSPAPPSAVAWKASYSLGGVFSNGSSAPANVTATLVETNLTDSVTSALQTVPIGLLGGGTASAPIAFTPLMQSWQWFDDITFIETAPWFKTFNYTVALTAQDPWGNAYQATSPGASVTVSVSMAKRNDQGAAVISAAFAAQLLASAAAVVGIPGLQEIAAGFFAAAAAAYGTAQALGSAARDPPVADPSYRGAVATKLVEIPNQLTGSPTLDALANVFRLMLEIAADLDGLSTVENRMLGAMNAGDRAALASQNARHTELVTHMNGLAIQLPASTGTALQNLQADDVLKPAAFRNLLADWKRTGVPKEIRQDWIVQGLPESTFSAIAAVVRKVPIEILLVSLDQQLASISLRISSWNATQQSEAPQLR